LDAPLKAELYSVLRQVRVEFGTPILLVTHDLEECFELGEEMMVLYEGKLVQSGSPRQVLERPANLEVAKLLGRFAVFQAEIVDLNPGAGRSLLRIAEAEIAGPCFPGRLHGDRVSLLVRPERVKATPAEAPDALELLRCVEKPSTVWLEFRGGLVAEMSRNDFEKKKHNKKWTIEFPSDSVSIL
jgi:ABC-type Fe3+/spermidine/putrescine transport system ATPase subunit